MRRVADDHAGLLGVEQFKEPVLFVRHVNLVVLVAFVAFAHIERKRLGFLRIAPDADDFFRVGMGEQKHRRVHSEGTATAKDYISFHSLH